MGEVLGLHWRDIDFADETIRIQRQWDDLGQSPPPREGLSVRCR